MGQEFDSSDRVCQRCQTHPASVHFTRVVNGEKSDRYLCEACARDEGAYHFMLGPQFTVQHVLGGLIGEAPGARGRKETRTKRCPHCGATYQRFAETGRLGCDRCYETFASELEPLIKRLHGSLEHHGKIPSRGGQHLIHQQRLDALRAEMQQAVAQELFEEAARIRDEIRIVEKQAAAGGGRADAAGEWGDGDASQI
ncbi:MAG: UvrB/UvrC motif-containing protein [Thermaerobacter sp.]|nr:UvrB/UvrC motif-containing protein [Thermaerobacter sp.]